MNLMFFLLVYQLGLCVARLLSQVGAYMSGGAGFFSGGFRNKDIRLDASKFDPGNGTITFTYRTDDERIITQDLDFAGAMKAFVSSMERVKSHVSNEENSFLLTSRSDKDRVNAELHRLRSNAFEDLLKACFFLMKPPVNKEYLAESILGMVRANNKENFNKYVDNFIQAMKIDAVCATHVKKLFESCYKIGQPNRGFRRVATNAASVAAGTVAGAVSAAAGAVVGSLLIIAGLPAAIIWGAASMAAVDAKMQALSRGSSASKELARAKEQIESLQLAEKEINKIMEAVPEEEVVEALAVGNENEQVFDNDAVEEVEIAYPGDIKEVLSVDVPVAYAESEGVVHAESEGEDLPQAVAVEPDRSNLSESNLPKDVHVPDAPASAPASARNIVGDAAGSMANVVRTARKSAAAMMPSFNVRSKTAKTNTEDPNAGIIASLPTAPETSVRSPKQNDKEDEDKEGPKMTPGM